VPLRNIPLLLRPLLGASFDTIPASLDQVPDRAPLDRAPLVIDSLLTPSPGPPPAGALGAIKQNAEIVLGLYREERYRPAQGVEGATELIVGRNRNGPTGFVDLFLYPPILRFEHARSRVSDPGRPLRMSALPAPG
jgi:hypothetical protein